jgi:hypothetical protein
MFSANVRKKSIGKMRSMRLLAVFLVPVIALILGAAAPKAWAQEVAEAELFFEYNSTDLDLGFDIFFDADAWTEATLTAPDGMTDFFLVNTGGGLFDKGNTEIMTESAEPPFGPDCAIPDECTDQEIADAIADFQSFFPDGTWSLEVVFTDSSSTTVFIDLSHDLPAAPDIRRPREEQSLKKVKEIKWRDASEAGDPPIISYEVVAEMVINGETFKITAILPGNARKFTIPKEFMRLARRAKKQEELEEFKVEVIARADNLNKTISELAVFEFEEEEEEE